MILILLVFIAFSIFSVFSYRTKFACVMSSYFLSLIALILAGALYFATLTTYQFGTDLDYQILRLLLKLRMSINDISLMHNIGIAILMLSAIGCINLVYSCRLYVNILLCLPVVLFLVTNTPTYDWTLYLAVNNGFSSGGFMTFLQNLSNFFVLLYFIVPMTAFAHYSFSTKIFLKRRYGLVCMSCIFFVYVMIYILFLDGVFTPMMFYNVDFLNFPKTSIGIYNANVSVLISILCVIIINVFIILYFKPFGKQNTQKQFAKRSQIINSNIYLIMHTYKNAFLGIKKLATIGIDAVHTKNTEEALTIYEKIEKEAGGSFEDITRMLSMLNDVVVDYRVFTIESCIDAALQKIGHQKIKIVKNYCSDTTIVLGSKYHMTESLVNLFHNSVEAISGKNTVNGVIEIAIHNEKDMLCIVIKDNGCGIPKQHIRKVFRPFYSTKSKGVGSGLGLDYVKNVALIHGGDVRIKSIENDGATVDIALPIYQKKEIRL